LAFQLDKKQCLQLLLLDYWIYYSSKHTQTPPTSEFFPQQQETPRDGEGG